jgi:hypothetical protein
VRQLQVRVGLVLSVPLPIVGQRPGLSSLNDSYVGRLGGVLVLVITQMKDKVGAILGEPPVGREVTLPKVRTRGETQGEVPAGAPSRSGQSAPWVTHAPEPGTGSSTRRLDTAHRPRRAATQSDEKRTKAREPPSSGDPQTTHSGDANYHQYLVNRCRRVSNDQNNPVLVNLSQTGTSGVCGGRAVALSMTAIMMVSDASIFLPQLCTTLRRSSTGNSSS